MTEDLCAAERFPGIVVLTSSAGRPMMQLFRHSPRDTDQETLLRLQNRLQQIKSRLIDIEARVALLRTTKKAMTLREFTKKRLNGKGPDDQKTYASHRTTAAEKYTAG
jgi:hypothetical protein